MFFFICYLIGVLTLVNELFFQALPIEFVLKKMSLWFFYSYTLVSLTLLGIPFATFFHLRFIKDPTKMGFFFFVEKEEASTDFERLLIELSIACLNGKIIPESFKKLVIQAFYLVFVSFLMKIVAESSLNNYFFKNTLIIILMAILTYTEGFFIIKAIKRSFKKII